MLSQRFVAGQRHQRSRLAAALSGSLIEVLFCLRGIGGIDRPVSSVRQSPGNATQLKLLVPKVRLTDHSCAVCRRARSVVREPPVRETQG